MKNQILWVRHVAVIVACCASIPAAHAAVPNANSDKELSGQITVDVIRDLGLAMAVDVGGGDGDGDGDVDLLLVLQGATVDLNELPLVFRGTVIVQRSLAVAREQGGTKVVVLRVKGTETRDLSPVGDVYAYVGRGLSQTVFPKGADVAPLSWDIASWFGVDSSDAPGRGVTCEAGGPFATACSRTCTNGATCSASCAEGSFACCRCVLLALLQVEIPLCTCQPVFGGGGLGGCSIHPGQLCPTVCPMCTVQLF